MGLFDRNNHDRDRGGWGGSPEYGGGQNRGGGFMGGVRRGWDRLESGVRDAVDRDDNRGGYDRGYGNRNPGGQGGGYGTQGGGYGTGYTAGGSYYDSTGYDRDMGGRGGWNADPNRSAGGGEELNRYGRDLGDQGNYGYRGTEAGWSTVRNHGRYDQDFGAQGNAYGAGYDRDYGARRGMTGGGTNFAGGGTGGMGMGNANRGYDQGSNWNDRNRDDWRSRSQTDAGDPFGDRQNQTPFRVVRGNQGGGGHWGGGDVDRGDRFDRGDMDRTGYRGVQGGIQGGGSANARGWNQGVGDDPYYNAQDFRGNYDNEYRGRPRDWF